MSEQPITETLAVRVLTDSMRLMDEKLAKLEAENRRLRQDAEGYLTANQSLFEDKARLIRQVTVLQADLAEERGR